MSTVRLKRSIIGHVVSEHRKVCVGAMRDDTTDDAITDEQRDD